MSSGEISFKSGVVRPIECFKDGWALIKNDYWVFLGLTLVAIVLGGMFLGILFGPMMCGLYLCLLGRDQGRPPSMRTLFKGFDFFPEGFVATLMMIVPMIVILAPLYIMIVTVVSSPPPPVRPTAIPIMFGFFQLVFVLVSLTIQALFVFVFPLIVDRRLKGMHAVSLSMRAATSNFRGVAGLVLINAVASGLGMCFCCIGVWLVLPLNFAAIAAAYRRVFPPPSE